MIKIDLIKKIGLSDDEINLYGTDFLLQYLKFHNSRSRRISVFFSGLTNEEYTVVKNIAILNNLIIKDEFSIDIDIVCLKEGSDGIKEEKGDRDFPIILSDIEFLEIFKEREYIVNKNNNIYSSSIYEEYRIVKPLSNFNYIEKVQSYSDENEGKFYTVNLYEGTCTCKDYILSNRRNFQNGDLRRYCKHLKSIYRVSFPQKELQGIKKYFFENRFEPKKNLKRISLPKLNSPLYLSYNLDGECVIYFPSKNNSFEKYFYDYDAEYFHYNDKPFGYVKDLRLELNNIFRPEKEFYKKKKEREKTKELDANIYGCFYFFVFIIIILILIFS